MREPPNLRYAECKRCDTCNNAEWVSDYNRVHFCHKFKRGIQSNKVCDDWEEEK